MQVWPLQGKRQGHIGARLAQSNNDGEVLFKERLRDSWDCSVWKRESSEESYQYVQINTSLGMGTKEHISRLRDAQRKDKS